MKISDGIKCLAVLSLAGYALTNAHAQVQVGTVYQIDPYPSVNGLCTGQCWVFPQMGCAVCQITCTNNGSPTVTPYNNCC
jgi:hypothetical protein